ncbi:cilia- and flagella-associated protein 44 [Aplysia californica]|uniref:Cilia- and flagella-associated protein 44 n=1 Tax=Aplysia californica TaxID=6500 RepID=A0ABM0JA29_APLCA|nr:cilia- and flagella-associated protein 44 [Aplysia californica]
MDSGTVVDVHDGENDEEEDEDESKKKEEEVHYEWESELEEYDEPDVYPSEKDYKWVEEVVEVLEDEAKSEKEEAEHKEDAQKEEGDEKNKEKKDVQIEEEKEGEKPGEEKVKEGEEKKEEGGEEEDDEHDDVFVQSAPEDEQAEDEEVKGPPKKKFKTVLVRKLIERPPKIHYEPSEERKEECTDDPFFYRIKPFDMIYSFGYDCQRMANLHVLDEETLMFMSGFVLTFFNHETKQKTHLRCLGGSSFGALAVHPSRKLFAAAEKGTSPAIGIWSWPKLQLFRKLQGGTGTVYASVNFSPDGILLASQGGEPDYLITVWNWLRETPILRVKSHAQDVYRVTFSKELAGNLTTSGLCHIKFWKMAHTFTGLKLKGDIGRFGKTELSDIEGYVEMPDGKVVSGSEWGNLLVWENGLIIAEICSRVDYPCHLGIVRQIVLNDGEFLTTGQDGWVRTWNFDAIDTAEIHTTEESLKVPLKVVAEVQVHENSDLWYLVKNDSSGHKTPYSFWFAQDGKGFIWKVDLSFLFTAKEPSLVMTAHGGAIVGCRLSALTCLMATLGEDGQIRVYNYITQELVASRTFNAPGTCLLWPSFEFDSSCATLIAGFADGVLRILSLSGKPSDTDLPMSINLEVVSKPHSRNITGMALDKREEFLVTGGVDGTIFFFNARERFEPMTFISMPEYLPVHDVQWVNINSFDDERKKVLVVLEGAVIQEVLAPKLEEIDNTTSYFFAEEKLLRRFDFKSVKSKLRHDEQLKKEQREEEERQKVIEEENRRKVEDGEETQEEQDLRLLAEAEANEVETKRIAEERKKWRPYIPPEPSPILILQQSPIHENTLILSLGKYDTGYLYVVHLQDKEEKEANGAQAGEPVLAIPIIESNDVPVTTITLSQEGDQMFMGFEDGRVRLQQLIFPYELENPGPHWTEGIHDCVRGSVTALALDKDDAFFVTCGRDGNCFLFSLLSKEDQDELRQKFKLPDFAVKEQNREVRDVIDRDALTLETLKNVAKEMALMAQAKKNKAAKREEIARLRLWYGELVKRNNELPEDVRLSRVELTITNDGQILKEKEFKEAREEITKVMAWECEKCSVSLNKLKNHFKDVVHCNLFVLKAFNSDIELSSFRIPEFPDFFEDAKDKVLNQRTPKPIDSEVMDDEGSPRGSSNLDMEPCPVRKKGMDKFVYKKMVRLWERRQKKVHRQMEWNDFLKTEPTDDDLREEEYAINDARLNMGDMKLKTAADYKVPPEKKLTTHRARKKLVLLEETMFNMHNDFNNEMKNLRQQKICHLAQIEKFKQLLFKSQKDLPEDEIKRLSYIRPLSPEEDPDTSFSYTKHDVIAYKQTLDMEAEVKKVPSLSAQKKPTVPPPQKKRPMTRRKSSVGLTPVLKMEPRHVVAREERDIGSYVEKISCKPSPLEVQIVSAKLTTARFNQDYYIELIEKEKFAFDAKLKLLRHKKVKLDYLLKVADARMVLLTNEFILARNNEAMEKYIEKCMLKASKEKKECLLELKVLNKKLDMIKKNLDSITKQRASLLNEVLNIATKAPSFEKYLIRVFKKKISKKKEKAEGSSDSDDDSDDSEDSDDDSDLIMDEDDEDDDGLDVDLPPSELSKEIYDSVIEVRTRRVNVDELEEAAKAVYDETNAAINSLKNRIASADVEFDSSRKKLDKFVKEMQEKQNGIDVAISVKKHQIYYMAADMEEALITENSAINRLKSRIPELETEKKQQKAKVQATKRTFSQLHRNKLKFLDRLEEMDKTCDEEMMKKFGAIRPIDVLENFQIDPEVTDLKNVLTVNQTKDLRELCDLRLEERHLRDTDLRQTIRQNEKLHTKAKMLSDVFEMQKHMEAYMNVCPKEVDNLPIKNELRSLRRLVLDQWRSIHALNLEVAQLTSRPKQPLPAIQKKNPPKL